ncbi:MAG: MBL fold metallo-hydrolase [Butyrivibrio sp.]|nr:MBL fold metallo-hydrolase [Butyrivibrio sp.]
MTDNIEVFTQNSIRIRGKFGSIYIDPFKMREEPHDASFVFVTHQHYDHFSIEDIMKVVGTETVLVVPESMLDDAEELGRCVSKIVTVTPGVIMEIDGIEVEAVPAYNNIKPFHPRRAAWVGYILNLEGKRIYIAGDTGLTKESRLVKCDVALVPIGGTYTMDYKKAAELINIIRPEFAIPTHYGSIVGRKSDAQSFAGLVKPPVRVIEKIQYFD